jgi:hypothetical protein
VTDQTPIRPFLVSLWWLAARAPVNGRGEGAGVELRQTLGTAVFSGMIGVTALFRRLRMARCPPEATTGASEPAG